MAKHKTAEEEYEDEEKSYKTHPREQDTLGEAIHRNVKEKFARDELVNSIPERHREHR